MIIPLRIWIVILIFLAGFWCGKNEEKASTWAVQAYHFVTTPDEWPHRCPSGNICLTKEEILHASPSPSPSPAASK